MHQKTQGIQQQTRSHGRKDLNFKNNRENIILSVTRGEGVTSKGLETRRAPDFFILIMELLKYWTNAFKIQNNIISNLEFHTQPNYQSTTCVEPRHFQM